MGTCQGPQSRRGLLLILALLLLFIAAAVCLLALYKQREEQEGALTFAQFAFPPWMLLLLKLRGRGKLMGGSSINSSKELAPTKNMLPKNHHTRKLDAAVTGPSEVN